MKFKELSLKGKLFYLAIICNNKFGENILVIVLFVFLGINWCLYKVLAFLVTPIPSLLIVIVAYVIGLRNIVTILAFPGTCFLFRRSLEYSFCKTMAAEVLKSITEFKNCIEIFLTVNSNE